MRYIFLLLAILCTIVLSGCDTSSGDSGSLIGLNAGPTSVASLDGSLEVAANFLDSWSEQDYEGMYQWLTPNAQDAYPVEEFTEIYTGLWEDLRLQGINWQQGDALLQGTTAVVNYDMSFQSRILGEFEDIGRIMRLVPTNDGMRVAWSRMDIFEGWAGGARVEVTRFLPGRGNIYDINGRVLADQNGVALPMYLTKNTIPSIGSCLDILVTILGREYRELQAIFDRYNADTLFYVGEIDSETYQQRGTDIDRECNPRVDERPTRRYFASTAPHVVGFVGQIPAQQATEYDSRGYPQDALVGIAGIEQSWETELRGIIGNRLTIRSATDERLRVITEKQPTPGESVYLTLDRDLQQGVTEALAQAYSISEPTWARTSPGAAVVVMDVRTGAILAMASYPSFDPGVFNPDTPYLDPGSIIQEYNTDFRRPLVNRAAQGLYPLGSVFKLLSNIAGADSTLVPMDTLYNCPREWNGEAYGDVNRTNWYTGDDGVLDGLGAIRRSCNPYYWQLAVTLNTTDPFILPNYARMFGYGERTGIRGIQEETGVVPDPTYRANQGFTWAQADASNLVIGQGDLLVTPLQVAGMLAAIANDGKLFTPYIVDRVQLIGEDPSFVAEPQFEELAIDPEIFAEVRDAMCQVTQEPSGTANFVFGDWYDFQENALVVCGKTGTAQSGANTQPHAWFGAYAPMDDPEIAIAVLVENSCEGSEVAAPITRRVVEIYYGLPEYGWPLPIWQGACSEIVVE